MAHLAESLGRDWAFQILTVQECLDAAEPVPGQFLSSLPALEILGRLGFGDEVVEPDASG